MGVAPRARAARRVARLSHSLGGLRLPGPAGRARARAINMPDAAKLLFNCAYPESVVLCEYSTVLLSVVREREILRTPLIITLASASALVKPELSTGDNQGSKFYAAMR